MAASSSSGSAFEPVTGNVGCLFTDTPRTDVVGLGVGAGGGGACWTWAGATCTGGRGGGGGGVGVGVGVGVGDGHGSGCTNPPAVPVRPKSCPLASADRLRTFGISVPKTPMS